MKMDWEFKALLDACTIKPPKSEARSMLAESDIVSFIPMEDLQINSKTFPHSTKRPLSDVIKSYTYFSEGDVLLAKITPCFENGKLGIAKNLVNGVGFGSSEFIVFRPSQELSNEWLYYFLAQDTFRVEGTARMTGAVGHKRVTKEFIENYQIPIPSFDEQKRIVSILDESFKVIDIAKANTEKNLQNARALFESYLNEIFSCKKGWHSKKLGEVCQVIAGQSPEGKYYNTEGIGTPFYQGKKNFSEKFIEPPTTWTTDVTKVALKDDILMSVRAPVGPINFSTSDICIGRGLAAIRSSKRIDKDFLFYQLLYLQPRIAGNEGAVFASINKSQIESIPIVIGELTEQKHIVSILDSLSLEIQNLESICQKKLTALEELKKSLLHQAFDGGL